MIEQKLSPIAQCEANVRRICAYHGIPIGALWEDPRTDERVRKVNAGDRVFFLEGRTGNWANPTELRLCVMDQCGTFTRSPLDMVQSMHGPTATHGWRENRASLSLQVVRHEITLPDGVAVVYEFDIDHGNPRKWWMAWPALVHLAEMIRPGPTDPYRIDRDLRKHRKELFA